MDIEKILKVAIKGNASDIILKCGSTPRFRYNGRLVSLSDGTIISKEMMQTWLEAIVPPHLKDKINTLNDLDFAFQSSKGYRFRANAFKQRQKGALVLRIISNHVKTIEELQLPPILNKITDEKRGLILVTGATGSGKSTTLAAMIQKINRISYNHIITIEDPIEYLFKDDRSTINQREIGIDAVSFPSALKSALRQNPDIILVGELRDKETIETALMAAETGHLVLTTLHTINAAESLTRIMSYFPPHQHDAIKLMLSQTINAIISQRLITRRQDQGMVAAFEILLKTPTIKDSIIKSDFDNIQDALKTNKDLGMMTFDDSILNLYKSKIISKEEALAQASNKDEMLMMLRGIA